MDGWRPGTLVEKSERSGCSAPLMPDDQQGWTAPHRQPSRAFHRYDSFVTGGVSVEHLTERFLTSISPKLRGLAVVNLDGELGKGDQDEPSM
jgi:hypothetical protein